MKTALLVGLGSFIGGSGRYLISRLLQQNVGSSFPYGTFAVNIIGCFLIGAVYVWSSKNLTEPTWQLFLTTGILGGFTTFSAFSFETVSLLRSGQTGLSVAYVLMSVMIGLLATWLGVKAFA